MFQNEWPIIVLQPIVGELLPRELHTHSQSISHPTIKINSHSIHFVSPQRAIQTIIILSLSFFNFGNCSKENNLYVYIYI